MSMLSAQCDELRSMAESVGLAVPQAATLMMEAADTIWELRCKCADLMGEREEYVWTREFMDRMAKHCGTKDCPSLVAYVEGLEAENVKLRELVRDAWGDGHPDRSCDGCDIRDECHDDVERMRKDGVLRFSRCLFELRIEERMRELGVEVDG